jgi:predicted RNase H-like nuclease
MTWVAGADGFKSRWCVVLHKLDTAEFRLRVVPAFIDLLTLSEQPQIVAVDIPIGLPEYAQRGGRACENAARRLLRTRASSVFSAVGRQVLKQENRLEADRSSRAGGGLGVGAQAWGLASKLREADAAMTPAAQKIVHEVHPELSFRAMNSDNPMQFPKRTAPGERDRQQALIQVGFPEVFINGMGGSERVGRDDFLDACAATWTAERIVRGLATRLPPQTDLDSRGLDQAMWF